MSGSGGPRGKHAGMSSVMRGKILAAENPRFREPCWTIPCNAVLRTRAAGLDRWRTDVAAGGEGPSADGPSVSGTWRGPSGDGPLPPVGRVKESLRGSESFGGAPLDAKDLSGKVSGGCLPGG